MNKLQQNEAVNTIGGIEAVNAGIMARGGVDGAIASDISSAQMKATSDQNAMKGALARHLMTKSGGSFKPEKAQEMADAIVKGNDGSNDYMQNALKSVASLASAQSGAKVGSDLTAIKAHGTPQQYISDKIGATLSKESLEAVSAQSFDDEIVMDSKVHAMIKKSFDDAQGGKSGQKKAQKKLNQLIAQGIATKDSKLGELGEDGEIGSLQNAKSTLGDTARKAYAKAKAGAMESDERLMIGPDRTNLATNYTSGETRIKTDSSDTSVYGNTVSIKTNTFDDRVAIAKTDGNMKEAQKRKESKEAADKIQNPKEWISNISEVLGNALGSEEAGNLATVVLAGGGAAAMYNATSQGDVKLSKKQLSGLTPIIDKETKKTTGYSKNNIRVADAGGNLVDSYGDKVQRGKIGNALKGLWSDGVGLKESFFSKKESTQESKDTQNTNNEKTTYSDIDKKTQGTPPNSDNPIITNKEDISKKVTGLNSKGKNNDFTVGNKNSTNAYINSNMGASSSTGLDNLIDKVDAPKGILSQIMDGVKNASGTKKLIVTGAALTAAASVTSSSSSLEASDIQAALKKASPQNDTGYGISNAVTDTIDTASLGFNALNAKLGLNEVKNGTKISQFMSDSMDFGMKEGNGILGKSGKFLAKRMPGIGFGLGMNGAMNRYDQGDYMGAAAEGISAVASLVPGPGTLLSAGIDTGLILRDRMNNPAPQHQGFATQTTGHNTTQAINAVNVLSTSSNSSIPLPAATIANLPMINQSPSLSQTQNMTTERDIEMKYSADGARKASEQALTENYMSIDRTNEILEQVAQSLDNSSEDE